MPTSNPIIPTQPKELRYGVDKLYTSPRWTRATYLKAFGVEAPPYNPAKQIKRWFFSTDAEDSTLMTLTVYDPTTRAIVPWYLLAADYRTPNLPGLTSYPKWENPVASPAVIVGPVELKLSGANLVDPNQAQEVADEINAQLGTKFAVTQVPDERGPWKVVYGIEPRRQMKIGDYDAALILAGRFEKGVGSPGKWSLTSSGGPQFEPDVPVDGERDLRPEVPMPCRPLMANERFATVTFGGMGGVIERTDLLPESQPGVTGLTAEQDRLLRGIATALGVQ